MSLLDAKAKLLMSTPAVGPIISLTMRATSNMDYELAAFSWSAVESSSCEDFEGVASFQLYISQFI
ncbi:hypothetical protein QA649_05005 [Bradyrhizobium sp. CB1717]|uniref:hypothetical protein n=1 Tax=Bradyrhizobium sp. CB1717 TaxID=3039154 RepID=UPI0024B04583|nr:hypothetical protein [Bradyrhizobium sp. CB1717]WFU25573.1 hypothetical protein QA649_05005 [Bradyrhizobium sp. CB1717]